LQLQFAPEQPVSVYGSGGLRISSALPLAAAMVSGAPDVHVLEGEVRPAPLERPAGDVLAERIVDGVPWYTFARGGNCVVARFYGLADFEIADTTPYDLPPEHEPRRVTYYRDPGAAPGLIALLIAGTVVAYLLSETGNLVLHASCVEVGSGALAFLGQSGQGKTTMATLLCADGHPFVADDLLPIDPAGEEVMCVPVGTELRVREKVEKLLERFGPGTAIRHTVDERRAVTSRATVADRLPLRAIVIPWPDRGSNKVTVRAVPPGEAALALARCQRVEGWTSPAILRSQFEAVSAVAGSVPVLEMRVPWGPPFRDGLGEEVLSAAGLATSVGWFNTA
jgi:hypothetical protein